MAEEPRHSPPEMVDKLRAALTADLYRRLRDPECDPEILALAADFLWDDPAAKH
jgi:hypothetical protein